MLGLGFGLKKKIQLNILKLELTRKVILNLEMNPYATKNSMRPVSNLITAPEAVEMAT